MKFHLVNDVLGPPHRPVSRNEWNAAPPKSKDPLKKPLKYVWITFTDTPECFTKEDCVKALQEMQKRDMDEGLSDIRYNFIVGGDVRVYEARGWHANNEARGHKAYDPIHGKSLDIAYIGPKPVPYTRNYPSIKVKFAMDKIIDYGINNSFIDSGFNDIYKNYQLV